MTILQNITSIYLYIVGSFFKLTRKTWICGYQCSKWTFLIDPDMKRRSLIRIDQGMIDHGKNPSGKFT